jgi:prevent-host-death family protein
MKPGRRRIPASVFKARCLALLDDVQETRETLVVTKRGRPVAMVVAVPERPATRSLRGSVRSHGDLVAPIGEDWEALR